MSDSGNSSETWRAAETVFRQAVTAARAVPYRREFKTHTYSFVGEGIEELLGVGAAEFTPALWGSLILESRPRGELAGKPLEQAIGEARQGRVNLWTVDHRIRDRKGREKWISDSAVILRDAAGIPYAATGILQDITERTLGEERQRLIEAQAFENRRLESLCSLAGSFAHDFNNLLVSILGFASLALEETPADSPIHEYLVEIERSSARAATLTRRLLYYAGSGRGVVENLDLSRLIASSSSLFEASFPRHVAMYYSLRHDLPPIEADASQMQQILSALITNSIEALGDSPGTITLRTGRSVAPPETYTHCFFQGEWPAEGMVYLEVLDSGPGMAPEVLARVFDPFFTSGHREPGRGLGLPAALGITRRFHGAILIESAPGKGTRVRVAFPPAAQAAREQTPAPAPLPAALWRPGDLALVVDDEPAVRGALAAILKRYGFHVLTAADGQQGVEQFEARRNDIRVTLMDLTMPRLSGGEAFRRIKDLRPDAVVILMSGFSEKEAVSRFDERQPAAFLAKPFRPEQLRAALIQALSPGTS